MCAELSVVIPMYDEENNVEDLYVELNSVLTTLNIDYEIIFIDDGSKDNTFQILLKLQPNDKHIRIIKLRKNFGKSIALNVAFRHAMGEIIITMDGDLQDDPKEIPRFIDKMDEGYDLVSGWKHQRKDPLTKTLPSKVFNKLTSFLIGINIHDFNCGFKAYRKQFLNNVYLYGEMHRYIPALAHWHGFTVSEIAVTHHPRRSGHSKYGISRILKGFLDLITVEFLMMYSTRPLHVFGLPGIISLLLGFIIGLYLISIKYFIGVSIGERPLLLLSVLLLFIGLQFVSIGLLGEMIAAQRAERDDVDIYIKSIF